MRVTSLLVVSLSLICLVTVACTSGKSCDCATSGVTIIATKGDVIAISSSGTACSGDAWLCVSSANRTLVAGCEQWIVNPARDGTCRIDVSLRDGSTRSAEFQIVRRTDGCCEGLYASGDGILVVSEADAGSLNAPTDASSDADGS